MERRTDKQQLLVAADLTEQNWVSIGPRLKEAIDCIKVLKTMLIFINIKIMLVCPVTFEPLKMEGFCKKNSLNS